MVVMALDLLHCNWMARRDKVGLPIIQFCTRISAGRLCLLSTPSLQAVPPDALDGRTVKRHPSSCCCAARHPLHLCMSLHGVLGRLAGDQDNVDSKNPKMCQFQATTSMQSGIHQAQGEG